MLKRYILFSFLLFGVLSSYAQPIKSVTYETMIVTAESAADNKDYANAIEWFEKAYDESRDKNLKIVIGDLYMLLRDYKRAERSYERALRRDRDGVFEFIRVDLAKALKYQGKYKEALQELRTVVTTTPDDSLKQVALFELEGLEKMETYNQNIEAVVRYIDSDLNSGSGENSPALYVDGNLYYSSFDRKGTITLDGKEEDYHAKIFSVAKNDEGEYEDPLVLDTKINREDFHTAGVSFSGDGRTMYFTRVQLNVNEITESKLYRAFRSDTDWESIDEVPGLNGDYLILHPYEGELFGNRVLFFSSDMEGGYGGLDLYYSTIRGDEFDTPVNLGPDINTEKDDITPYYTAGTLYYSTNGKPGFGGHDIWYATWNGAKFVDNTNMGFNYNSPQDDMYFRFNPDGKSGFLVSNRPDKNKRKLGGSETCCDDIYEVGLSEIVLGLYVFVNDQEGNPLTEATVEIVDMGAMDENEGVEGKTNAVSNDFNFLLEPDRNYRMVVTREGYYPDTSVRINTYGFIDSYSWEKNINLNPLPKEPEEDIEIVEINQPIRLNNIYYDFEKWDILPDAEDDLDYLAGLMEEYPDMVIELSSHTDSRGVSTYNQQLSQKRAESAKNWLIENGIAAERINAVGYGESVILNRCSNGVRCSEEEHRLNRRTEFKIIAGPKSIKIDKKVIRKKSSPDNNGGGDHFEYHAPVPVISFVHPIIDIGAIEKGSQKEVVFHFTNTGDEDLLIELVTACKCTNLTWPKEAVKPGEQAEIKAVFDTSEQALGPVSKTLDIIANTDPIVVEAKFKAVIVDQLKKTDR